MLDGRACEHSSAVNGVTTLLDVTEVQAPRSFDMDEWPLLALINSRNAFSAQPDTHYGMRKSNHPRMTNQWCAVGAAILKRQECQK